VNRRANVVTKAGQRHFQRAHAAAGRGFRLHHQHTRARLRQRNGRRQPVGARADDHGVVAHLDFIHLCSESKRIRQAVE
jgi:hypothetical protein